MSSEIINDTQVIREQQVEIKLQQAVIIKQNAEILNTTQTVMREKRMKPEVCQEIDDDDDNDDFVLSPQSFKIAIIALTVHFLDYIISSYFAPKLGIKRHLATKA